MRFKSFIMRLKEEDGQAIILVVLAMSIFLLGAIGLAIDGSNLYAHRQMAQAAADAAAQAGMMSIFAGTSGTGAASFVDTPNTSFDCTTSDTRTPCVYASRNGFVGGSADDTVTVSFPDKSTVPGVAFSPSATDPTSLIKVSVSRNVGTTLMRLLGPTATTVKATATAAIVSVVNPTPILVTHPYLPSALSSVGTKTLIKICGGPSRSIEINSSDPNAFVPGTAGVDLSHAGPDGSSDCSTAAGADFAVFGGPTANPNPGTAVNLGTGQYISHATPIQDPFANVTPPAVPTTIGSSKTITAGTDGCIFATCIEYSPGLYVGGIDLKAQNVIFQPGVYYMQGGGFNVKQTKGGGANFSSMCVGCVADPKTGMGILVYDSGPAGSTLGNNPSGGFQIANQNNISFQGPTLSTTNALGVNGCTLTGGCVVPAAPYFNIAFWEDRTADSRPMGSQAHQLGQGGGAGGSTCFQVTGTIYITNTQDIMTSSNGAHYQAVSYGGTPCSTTVTQGDIIVGTLQLNGNAAITMNLVPFGFLTIRQVAMVN